MYGRRLSNHRAARLTLIQNSTECKLSEKYHLKLKKIEFPNRVLKNIKCHAVTQLGRSAFVLPVPTQTSKQRQALDFYGRFIQMAGTIASPGSSLGPARPLRAHPRQRRRQAAHGLFPSPLWLCRVTSPATPPGGAISAHTTTAPTCHLPPPAVWLCAVIPD